MVGVQCDSILIQQKGSLPTQTNFSKFEPWKCKNLKFRNQQKGLLQYAWLEISEFRNVELSQDILLPTYTINKKYSEGKELMRCLRVL